MDLGSRVLPKWERKSEVEEPESEMPVEDDPTDLSAMTERENSSELPLDMSEWTTEQLAAYNNLRSKRKKCCVGGCTHRSIPIARSYHQLPVRNKEIWAKWIEVIRWSRNEPDWAPNGDAAPLVCSRHFPESDFISYEASSRVRLSHTAIPVYYVDPPEGTQMDPRFSQELPLPPIVNGGGVKKESSKSKKMKMDTSDEYASGHYNNESEYINSNNSSLKSERYGYDIEEVNADSYDHRMPFYSGGEHNVAENYFADNDNSNDQAINYSSKANSNSTAINLKRLSAPPTLINYQRKGSKINAVNAVKNSMPALIRANFKSPQPSSSSQPQFKPIPFSGSGNMKTILKKDSSYLPSNGSSNVMRTSNSHQTKHKIGLAKCRLIVQTLENQLKIAKMRLAEQLDIPFQVVQGVWNMKDSLRDKL